MLVPFLHRATTWTVRNRYLVDTAQRLDKAALECLHRSRRYAPDSQLRVDLEELAESFYEQSAAIMEGILMHGYIEGEC